MQSPLLTLAKSAALEAGKIIMSHYGKVGYTLKDDQSPVTIADHDANECIVNILKESTIPILSEELPAISLPYPETLWVIDPLDGTKGFVHGTDDFSVMIALLTHGKPVLGVVYAPALGVLYYATEGHGAFVEDEEGTTTKLSVSSRVPPNLRIIKSVNHAQPYMDEVARALRTTEEVAIGSVGIKTGFIAGDRGDFYLTRGNLGEWDVCAPEIIIREAGGTITDTHGTPLTYGTKDHRIEHGVVISNGTCHSMVIDALALV